jgi:cardiolipin synthase
MWKVVLLTAFATVLITILVLNLQAGEKHIRYEMDHTFAVQDPEFLRTMNVLLGPTLEPGNRITALQNGDEIFPAMLAAIRSAQHSVTFETYIYWSGQVGKAFADALGERARAGIKVHVLLDWVGAGKLEEADLESMKTAGVEVEYYHPLHWYNMTRINQRTHRKLLIVDGRIGFTGGVGVADHWLGHAQSPEHWRESHYRIEGPAVGQMQTAFIDNWIKTKAVVLFGERYFPKLDPIEGGVLAQMFRSSRGEGSESVRLMYLLSISSAMKHIRLQAAYFIPDDLAVQAFVTARQRGVKIEIIVPGPVTDAEIVRNASRSRWGALLDAGVEIYEYQPTMYHCKVLIVDDLWVSVGSTNFDDRSFRLNDEANLNIFDGAFAVEQAQEFELDKAKSKRIIRAEFKDRSAVGKLIDHLSGLIRRQL